MRNFDHDLTTQLTKTLHKHSDGLNFIDLHIYYFLIRFWNNQVLLKSFTILEPTTTKQ